jgi:hypothetical protein
MKWWIFQALKYGDHRSPEGVADGEKLLRRLKRKRKAALAKYKAKHEPAPPVVEEQENVVHAKFGHSQR